MQFKEIISLFLCILMLFTLCSCKKKEEEIEEEILPEIPAEEIDPNFPVTLEFNDETLTLDEAPTKIVSLSPAITQLFYDLGEEKVLKGVSSYAPEVAAEKSDCGTPQLVDLEMLESIKPQLLFTDTPLLSNQLTEIYQMDIDVIYIPRPKTKNDIINRAELILLALYGNEDGAKLADNFSDDFMEDWYLLKGVSDNISERKSAVFLGDLNYAAGGDCFEGEILEILALKNVCSEGENWQLPSKSTDANGNTTYTYGDVIVEFNPDIIFFNSNLSEDDIKNSEFYSSSNAVKNSQIFPVNWNVIQLQSEDFTKVLIEMSKNVYPDIWEKLENQDEQEEIPATTPTETE